jgi:hypothetical protein
MRAYLYIKALLQLEQVDPQIYKALEIYTLNTTMQEPLPLIKRLLAINYTFNLL